MRPVNRQRNLLLNGSIGGLSIKGQFPQRGALRSCHAYKIERRLKLDEI